MKKHFGFSLIELMVVVVIIAILAMVAYPAYQDYIRKARRADAMGALLDLQTKQEKWRINNTAYSSNLGNSGLGYCFGSSATCYTPDEYYILSLDSAGTTGYTLTATGQGDQAKDKAGGTTCTLKLEVSASNPRGEKKPEDCW